MPWCILPGSFCGFSILLSFSKDNSQHSWGCVPQFSCDFWNMKCCSCFLGRLAAHDVYSAFLFLSMHSIFRFSSLFILEKMRREKLGLGQRTNTKHLEELVGVCFPSPLWKLCHSRLLMGVLLGAQMHFIFKRLRWCDAWNVHPLQVHSQVWVAMCMILPFPAPKKSSGHPSLRVHADLFSGIVWPVHSDTKKKPQRETEIKVSTAQETSDSGFKYSLTSIRFYHIQVSFQALGNLTYCLWWIWLYCDMSNGQESHDLKSRLYGC